MSYLTKEEKQEYKQAKKFFGLEASKVLIVVLILTLLLGGFGVGYKLTIGRMHKDADREVFEHSKSYVHGMVEDLSRHKLELTRTEDEVERKAIIVYIQENYANFDTDLIESDSLRWFLEDVMNGEVE